MTAFVSLAVLNVGFYHLEKHTVAIRCTVRTTECPSPSWDSRTVFALQVRLLEDEISNVCDFFLQIPFPPVPVADSVPGNLRVGNVLSIHWLSLLPD